MVATNKIKIILFVGKPKVRSKMISNGNKQNVVGKHKR